MVHCPAVAWLARHAHVRMDRHFVGMSTQVWVGTAPTGPPSMVLQYWLAVWHVPSPHEKHGAGAASIDCQ